MERAAAGDRAKGAAGCGEPRWLELKLSIHPTGGPSPRPQPGGERGVSEVDDGIGQRSRAADVLGVEPAEAGEAGNPLPRHAPSSREVRAEPRVRHPHRIRTPAFFLALKACTLRRRHVSGRRWSAGPPQACARQRVGRRSEVRRGTTPSRTMWRAVAAGNEGGAAPGAGHRGRVGLPAEAASGTWSESSAMEATPIPVAPAFEAVVYPGCRSPVNRRGYMKPVGAVPGPGGVSLASAPRHGSGCHIIFRHQSGPLVGGARARIGDIGEKAAGELDESGVVPDP